MTKSTSLCLETIKVVNGIAQHLSFHQRRFDTTRKALFENAPLIRLSEQIKAPNNGLYRVRIEYDSVIQKIEYIPYEEREFHSFHLVEANVEYGFKWLNRDALNALERAGCDDVLITSKGLLKDTSIANIALWIEGEWLTPKHPLLEGTTRSRLLASGFLKARDLDVHTLQNAQKFAIMNALIGFKIINNVFFKE